MTLLKLEDLGLASEGFGYPAAKRIEYELEVTQMILPDDFTRQFDVHVGGPYQNKSVNVQLHACLVYENHVLTGNRNRLEFVWQ